MGGRIRDFDWSATPVGPIDAWPRSLTTTVRILLGSRYAMWLGWGPDLTFFYNDAYARMTLGPKHPWALGRPAREVWSEIWGEIGPRALSVLRTGEATWDEGLLLFLERNGFPEETYHTFSYSPVPDDAGGVGGMLCVVTEDTERTIGERRLKTLRELAARTTEEATTAEAACRTAARTLAGNPNDLPFVLLYLASEDGRRVRLLGHSGVATDSPACPREAELGQAPWPFDRAAETGSPEEVDVLRRRFGPLPGGPWPEPAERAVVLPMARPGQGRPAGFVVAGLSPRLVFNDAYRGFLDLLTGHIATAVANARAFEEEKKRAEGLAELDRAKTAFFSNVSHEFRTPLTLMLGPVEDVLRGADGHLPDADRERLEVARRNGLRLQRLVNTLLDFARIEAGRVRATYEPTDLAALTADLVSNFRSACERAGLDLSVDCPPLGEPVLVDRGMWEQVVLNLLSNAFKFTFDGGIAVALRRVGGAAELRVRDTGTGIAADEMTHLFERFHRVKNARGRTHEGSGIGLALVQELVRLHGGSIATESEVGRGTTFTVSIPLGSAHLPHDRVSQGPSSAEPATATAASAFVGEAMRWLPDVPPAADDLEDSRPALGAISPPVIAQNPTDRPRVLVADDNADMRAYVSRLLAGRFQVDAVADGEAALAAARRHPPDLVLSDVMMPRLDGFGLLRALRADPRTADVPVVLLSARAGEDSRIQGVEAGADDYLVKPFSARELVASVSGQVEMARVRRAATASVRESEGRLRAISDNLPQGAVYQVVGDPEGSRQFLYISAGVERLFGVTPAEALANAASLYDLVHADDRPRVAALEAAAVRDRAPFDCEFRSWTRAGELVWVHARSAPRSLPDGGAVWEGVIMDVTSRKRAEEALARERELFHTIFDRIPVMLTVYDPDASVLRLNPAFERTVGWSAAEAANVSLMEACYPDPAHREKVRAFMDSCRDGWLDLSMRTRDGQDLDTSWANVRLTDGTRVGIGLDISDRKRAEDALRQADRRKDEFLATLAHELRNPLAPIRNGLHILRLAGNDGDVAELARTMMERQLDQMVHLVDDLLDLSRISRGKIELRKERVELAKVVQQAVETSRPAFEQAGHDLAITMPPGPVFVDADPTRLAQVVSNLLTNAAKYTEPRGKIHLTVERRDDQAVVSVRDTGVGIAPDMLPKVFDMFTQVGRTLERSQGGLGIGLSIVKRLVEMHGGTVEARSDGPGTGSEFIVRLEAAPAPDTVPGAEGAVPLIQGRRILVVDDNKDAATSLALMLDLMGNETQTAHDGLEALAAGATFRPDVILLDIGMPRLDGYATARRVRGEPWGRDVVLVALTGWGQPEDRRRSDEAGFDHHLVKPVEAAALARLLAESAGRIKHG
jgi:PAS domain S-box-containing protein